MKRLLLLVAFVAFPMFGQELRLDRVLHGGGDALIAIDAMPAGAEEWEAFLSVDGGAHYAVRITPHLDGGIRSYRFRVPNVSTRDARILIRTGDEVHERIVTVPGSFAIKADFARIEPFGGAAATEERGESARFDDDRVVEWREADREMRHRETSEVGGVASSVDESPEVAAPVSVSTSAATPRLTARIANIRRTRPTFRAVTRDTLLLSTRLNV